MTILDPMRIESRSFEIIREEADKNKFRNIPENMKDVVVRVIHSTADFDFLDTIKFSEDFHERAVNALKKECFILTDIKMVKYGISQVYCQKYNIITESFIDSDDVVAYAKERGISRSMSALRLHGKKADNGLIVIGNAPTALFETMSLIKKGSISPAAVIGVPVGFVGAAESKEALYNFNKVPFITALGRKGGTPVAVSIVNALLRQL
jgi:precorrin-8X/cobalt-precorrin-8 methylmutase